MKGIRSILPAAMAVGAGLLQTGASLPTVTTNGTAFFAGGERFYIRGVDYQPGGSSQLSDPLADSSTCNRDIPYFQQLGINAVRVYSVDNSKNHDACMSALDKAGIYLILDVNSPEYSLNREDPAPSYNPTYLQSIFATMDMFSQYENTLAFFSGNEVINDTTASTACAPYIKAVTRDMKQYQGDRQLRKIPIGYSAADVSSNRYETAEYMNCGTDDERSDFFAFNDYSWCDPSSFQTSGWDQKVQLFSNYSLPIFLSEYGCNTNTRTFQEVAALYNQEMTAVYSGGLVYEYSNEASNYGLVTISGNSVSTRPDFQALQSAYKNTSNPTGDGGFTTSNKPSQCPSSSSTWMPKDDSLPAMPDGAKKYLTQGAGTGPGLQGNDNKGSQNAGGASTATATPGSGAPSTTATMGSGSGTGSSGSPGSSSKSAAAGSVVPDFSMSTLVCSVVVLFWTGVGAALL